MTAPEIPPFMTAALDQARTELVDVVGAVREHVDAEMCELPGACPGARVNEYLAVIGPHRRRSLLYLALSELADLDYGQPVHLTQAAVAALNKPTKGRRWWSWLRR